MTTLSPELIAALVERLDSIDASDPERAHSEADNALIMAMPDEVQAAYERLKDRCDWWACG
jgi:hypothetical protein